MKDTGHRRRCAPVGIDSKLPVGMRLMPEERAELIDLAEREQRSIGSMARLIYLKGLETMKRETTA